MLIMFLIRAINQNMDPKKTHQPRQVQIMEKQNDHTIREACGLSNDCLISKLEFQISSHA